jgi:hypothetical protein
MNYLFLLCLLVSHGVCALPFIRNIHSRQMPRVIDFVPLSFFLYYDAGVALEVFGLHYENPFFYPFLSKPDIWTSLPFLILLIAPWVVRCGAKAVSVGAVSVTRPERPLSCLRPDLAAWFYALSSLLCVGCAASGLYIVATSPAIWISRLNVSELLGPYVIVLYLPMFVLAYYIQQRNVRPGGRTFFVLFLVISSVLATLPIGERTNVLLPGLIVGLFYNRLNLKGMAIAFLVCATAAALILPLFKAEQSDNEDNGDLVTTMVNGDFSRFQILVDVADRSPMIGTRVLPYSGSGFVYSLLFFVPRSVAPFKGKSTAVEYTSAKTSTPPSVMNWGLGVGVIEEIILNFGLLAVLPGLFFCGVVIGVADRLAEAVPATGVGLRLAAIWVCGYHLPALLQEFGAMVLAAVLLSRFFSARTSPNRLPSLRVKA